MYPHERSLVEKYRGRPFVLIGVNSDATREYAKKVTVEQNLPWRSFFDGPLGPIARAWGVNAWPTIYLIDHRGVIRFKNLRGAALERAIEQLVREAEAERAGGTGPKQEGAAAGTGG